MSVNIKGHICTATHGEGLAHLAGQMDVDNRDESIWGSLRRPVKICEICENFQEKSKKTEKFAQKYCFKIKVLI